jgi:D-lactate dehydrogenase
MKVAVFSAKPYGRQFLDAANTDGHHELRYLECPLTVSTTALAKGSSAVCLFANDHANATTIMAFAHMGVRLITLRSAGFNNVDLEAARSHGITVARVPAYSPNAVAEHTFALVLSFVRKVHRAYNRVREGTTIANLDAFERSGRPLHEVAIDDRLSGQVELPNAVPA